MATLLSELRHSFDDRVGALEREIDGRLGRLEPTRSGARAALEVVQAYPAAVRKSLKRHLRKDRSDEHRIRSVRNHIAHAERVWAVFDRWFGRGSSSAFPRSLVRAVDEELRVFGSTRRAVLAVGPPGELEAWVPDLVSMLQNGLAAKLPPRLAARDFAMIQVPPLEAAQALWRPLIIGHELMHILLLERPDVLDVDLAPVIGTMDSIRTKPLREVRSKYAGSPDPHLAAGKAWLEELLCDAYAVRRFGPAAVAAFASFLDMGTDEDYVEHPPSAFRLYAMLRWVNSSVEHTGGKEYEQVLTMLEPARERASVRAPSWPPWVRAVTRGMAKLIDDIPSRLDNWPDAYDAGSAAPRIVRVAKRLGEGIPSDVHESDAGIESLGPPDVLNGAWLSWMRESKAPVDRLALKSLETIEFAQLWRDAEQGLRRTSRRREPEEWDIGERIAGKEYGGVLPSHEIMSRLRPGPGQIHVVPAPQNIDGTAMDLRLGNRFIVFEPSGIAAFDPIETTTDPRVIQGLVEKDWGEPFVLHPGDLVLAAANEYVALPGDVSCLVVTRSSYGRLGLVTATAVLVHPYFHGCLTLELVNLGTVPLKLTPGERVAQLTFLRVHEPVDPPKTPQKYGCPTGPEFSKIHSDRDARVLMEIRDRRMMSVKRRG